MSVTARRRASLLQAGAVILTPSRSSWWRSEGGGLSRVVTDVVLREGRVTIPGQTQAVALLLGAGRYPAAERRMRPCCWVQEVDLLLLSCIPLRQAGCTWRRAPPGRV